MLWISGAESLVRNVRQIEHMSFFSPFEPYQVVLAVILATAWGLGCSVFERIVLTPRRTFSALGAGYAPAMTLALLAGTICMTTEGRSFLTAILAGAIFFSIGCLPALASFHVMRLALRSRFFHR